MLRNIHTILVFIVFASLSVLASGQDAQIPGAHFQGQVLDNTGAAVPKAPVRVIDQQTSTERKTETNLNGEYTVFGLRGGVYKIIVEAPGFGTATSDDLKLNPGQAMIMNFTLKVAATVGEVMVTAQKREEKLNDVPMSITVLEPRTLAEAGQNRLLDYFADIPGLSAVGVSAVGAGTSYVTIRGLSAGAFQNPTVANVIDDVPVGSSLIVEFGSALTQPDLDPSDLTQIEVLKGPQGTLYGADSLGGLIKYVTADPSTSAVSGRAEVTGVGIPDGGTGGAVRGAVNVPLSHVAAIRASGFFRRDPGYIDDLTTGQNNINSANVYGGHVSLLFRPSDNFSLKLGALIQNREANGSDYVNSNNQLQFPQGDLKETELPGTNPYQQRVRLYTAEIKAKAMGLDFVSVSGYDTNFLHSYVDTTGCCGGFFGPVANKYYPGLFGTYVQEHFYTQKFSQEVRVSSSLQHWLDWTVGGFFTRENSPGDKSYNQNVATDLTKGIAPGSPQELLVNYSYPSNLTEYAVFGDATLHMSNRLDVQLGARQSWNTVHYNPVYTGPALMDFFGVPSPDLFPPGYARGTPFTYLVAPKFAITPDLQVYARIATGYRFGGPNLDGGLAGTPLFYKPDKTINYELGAKGDVLDHRLNFAAAAYYIKWSNIQLTAQPPNSFVSYIINVGDAKSEGVELSIDARPARGLSVGLQGSYNNAVLTQDLPASVVAAGAYGLAGDRLPYNIKFSGGLTAKQNFALPKDGTGFVGGDLLYVGSRAYEFAAGPPPYTPDTQRAWLPGYTQLNLRCGARFQATTISIFANNGTNKRGIAGYYNFNGNLGDPGGTATPITPRAIGLDISRSF
jgi:iron complex outermembrane receptor protein